MIPYGKHSISIMDVFRVAKQMYFSSLTQGPKIKEFEELIAAYVGAKYAIAVSSAKRSPSMPDVPTFVESGVKDFVIDDWVGLLAPAKTPKPIVTKLNQALKMSFLRK